MICFNAERQKTSTINYEEIRKSVEKNGVVKTSRLNNVSHTTIRRWLRKLE